MNVLFLDIDGVLNSRAYWEQRPRGVGRIRDLDPTRVRILNSICQALECKVCIIGAMRVIVPYPKLGEWLQNLGLERGTELVIGQTESYGDRELEISKWLKSQNQVEKIVILDDDHTKLGKWAPWAVKTWWTDSDDPSGVGGLSDRHLKEAIERIKPFK